MKSQKVKSNNMQLQKLQLSATKKITVNDKTVKNFGTAINIYRENS